MPSSNVMGEFKRGTLHSGSKHGPKVTNRKQAVAIMLSEKRKEGGKVKTKYYGSGPFSKAEEEKGFKVLCDANDLNKMNVDRYENVKEYTLASRREANEGGHSVRRTLRRSESTKGSY